MRFFCDKSFHEELLALIPLEGYTNGEAIYQKLIILFEKFNLDLQKIHLLVTDGAPSMIGRIKGVAARMSNVVPHLQCLHCIIHRAVCSKLSDDLKDIMDTVIVIINLIRSTSSLQHRLFSNLLDDVSAEYQDLLIHFDVRWLSKGEFLDRFCDLKDEILVFLL